LHIGYILDIILIISQYKENRMKYRIGLFFKAVFMFIVGFICIASAVFIPAGTICFPGGLLFCAALFIPILIMMIVLTVFAPELLEKRLRRRESERTQKRVVGGSALMFILGFITAGLDFRFGISQVPLWLMITAAVVMLLSYLMLGEVMRENAFLSRTIEVQQGQKVVDTGLYSIVRHPMYTATTVMFLMMPLVLGSFASFIIFLIYPVLIVIRILNEEKILSEGLDGYNDYKRKVRYRLIPFIW